MKLLLASSLLLGAASASQPQQQVLKSPSFESVAQPASDAWSKGLKYLEHSMEGMTGEAKKIWDDVSTMFPESMPTFFSSPKPHSRKPDSVWDFVVKGADVQNLWVQNAKGESEREVDGKLSTYNLRAKKVDPSKLGVDTVKQYSGYLDDEENDKHLFYCKLLHTFLLSSALTAFRVL